MAARSSSAWISGERAVTGFFSLLGLPPRRRGDMVHNAKMIDSQQQKTSSFSIDQRGGFFKQNLASHSLTNAVSVSCYHLPCTIRFLTYQQATTAGGSDFQKPPQQFWIAYLEST
jgi:hypothetical protein